MINIFHIVFAAALTLIAVIDLKAYKIPNAILLGLLLLFIPYLFVLNLPINDAFERLIFAGVSLGIGWFFYTIGWFGAGDAKYLGVLALWLGFEHAIPFLLFMAIASFAVSSLSLRMKKTTAKHTTYIKRKIPFGIVLSMAGLGVMAKMYFFS
jgi:prepilin peptidase CpaA